MGSPVEEEMNGYAIGNMRHVLEGLLWESIRAFLVPDDVLSMRTTARKWNVDLSCYFFLMKKDSKYEPVLSDDNPTMKCEYSQLVGFDSLWRDPARRVTDVNHRFVPCRKSLSTIRSDV